MVGQLLRSVLLFFFKLGNEFVELLCQSSITRFGGHASAVVKVDKGLDVLPPPPQVVVYEVVLDLLPLSHFSTLYALM